MTFLRNTAGVAFLVLSGIVSAQTFPSFFPTPKSVTIYVAPNGNDSWSGRLPWPNFNHSDGPLATFDQARQTVQSINKAGLSLVNVQFRNGTYSLPATEMFTAADSGSPATPIVYQNFPGESPVLSGGVRVQNWTALGHNKWQTALPASTQYFENLFYNGVRRLRPRVGGYLGTYYRFVGTVYLTDAEAMKPENINNCAVHISGMGWECFDRFYYDSTDPNNPISPSWQNLVPSTGNVCKQPAGNQAIAGDIEILDFEQFETSKMRVSCVDPVKQIVYTTGPTAFSQANPTQVGFIAGNRFLIENVRDALTEPGQWFLDLSNTPWTLTYLARDGENPNRDVVMIPQLPQLLIASDLKYVTFQGLTFEHDNFTIPFAGYQAKDLQPGIPGAVSIQNSRHITFDSVTLTQISGAGLEFISCFVGSSPSWCANNNDPGTANNVVKNSAFFDLGGSGIRIGEPGTSADSDGNLPQAMLVENNVVEGYGRIIPAAFGIGQGAGHDNTYTHNDVYDGFHVAISVCECNSGKFLPNGIGTANNTISFNHVYDLQQGIMNDGGSIRVEVGDEVFTAAGNKVLNNRVHDISDAGIMDPNGYGGDGIYLDDQTGLVDVENNLVYRVSGNAVYTPHGPAAPNEANTIKNNILAYARQSMIAITTPYPDYPKLPAILPTVFTISNNLMYFDRNAASLPNPFYVQGKCTYTNGAAYTQYQQWSSNLYWRTDGSFANDPQAFHVQPDADVNGKNAPCTDKANKLTFYSLADWKTTVGEDANSIVRNPHFVAPFFPLDDYRLLLGSPGVGFVPFDPNEAGRLFGFRNPPPVTPSFPTQLYNPFTDF